jgi:thioredoxin reductase
LDSIPLDVAVIGGGPAGLSACLELFKGSDKVRAAIFDSEAELGGIPKTSRFFFGMRDLKRIYTGPTYVQELNKRIRKTPAEIHTEATILKIIPDEKGESHSLHVASPDGFRIYRSRFVVLCTGCCESPFAERLIPSARPAGIFTTWQLQQMVYLYRLKPGTRAVVIGSETAAFSTVMTLRHAGTYIAALVEKNRELQTYPFLTKGMSRFYGFPIRRRTSVKSISGTDRVEAVELLSEDNGKTFPIDCDTVAITGRFRPNSNLIDDTTILRDAATGGPLVDMNLMTSVPNIFAAGNVLRGGDMHDLCALEGRWVARSIVKSMTSHGSLGDDWLALRVDPPIRYIVPQKIAPLKIKSCLFPMLSPGVAIQVEETLKDVTLQGWSGERKIWERSYRRLLGNHRIPIPVEKFDWKRIDFEKGVLLKIKGLGFHG